MKSNLVDKKAKAKDYYSNFNIKKREKQPEVPLPAVV
jgi:hypothetical protein